MTGLFLVTVVLQLHTLISWRPVHLALLSIFFLSVSGCSGSGDDSDSSDTPTPTPTQPASIHASVYGHTVVEGADDLEFVISLSAPSDKPVTIEYETEDNSAVAGTDYIATSGSMVFNPGETRKFVPVSVLTNASAPTTSSKSFQLRLSTTETVELDHEVASGTIIDNHAAAISAETEYDDTWSTAGSAFTNASTCGASCHQASGTTMIYNGKDISPNTQWKHSVMANAFADPYWQAAVEDEVESFPHLAGFIEDTCTTCHAPMGRTHAHHTNTNLDADGKYRFNTAEADDASREGVSCTACHQIDAGNLDTDNSFSGGFYIEGNPLDSNYKKVYGPYASPVGSNMSTRTGHTPTFGAYISESRLCATCHTLFTPSLDPTTGVPSGTQFLEQGVYFEWQNSLFANGQPQEAQCQDCHMPEPAALYETDISLQPASAPLRTPYGQHTLVGGNTHLLQMLRDYRVELGISNTTTVAGFDEQIAITQNLLATSASLSLPAISEVGSTLEFDVGVINNSGHKIPTAYPSRRTWLHVLVKDGAGDTIFESGKPDTRGYISSDSARLKADCMSGHKYEGFDSTLCYEPHRDLIDDESQIAIYETVLGDVNGEITHTLLQGTTYLKDNRIPPLGFTDNKAQTIEPQTIPAGISGDGNFNCKTTSEGCGIDTVSYRVDIDGKTGPFTVDVRLLYQATQPGFVDGMHNDGDRVNRFKVMYDVVPPTVEVIDTVTLSQ